MSDALTSRLLIFMAAPAFLSPDFFFSSDLRLLLEFFGVVGTSFKICLHLHVFFEVVQDVILPELEPMKVNVGVVRITLLDGPPRPVSSE